MMSIITDWKNLKKQELNKINYKMYLIYYMNNYINLLAA